MITALKEQMEMEDINDLTFEERLGLLADREMVVRETRRLNTRLRKASLRQNACIEDVDFRQQRGLDKSLIVRLADAILDRLIHNAHKINLKGGSMRKKNANLTQ